jgi:hypothetical protein
MIQLIGSKNSVYFMFRRISCFAVLHASSGTCPTHRCQIGVRRCEKNQRGVE